MLACGRHGPSRGRLRRADVMQRGNNRQDDFFAAADRRVYLAVPAQRAETSGLDGAR